MTTTGHGITQGTVYGPNGTPQPFARCECEWVQVAVTSDSLNAFIRSHFAQVARDTQGGVA